MQKAKVTRPPKALGQHMLQHQPQELRTRDRALLHPASLGVAITETHIPVLATQDVFFPDHAPIKIATQIDQRFLPVPTDLQSTTQVAG